MGKEIIKLRNVSKNKEIETRRSRYLYNFSERTKRLFESFGVSICYGIKKWDSKSHYSSSKQETAIEQLRSHCDKLNFIYEKKNEWINEWTKIIDDTPKEKVIWWYILFCRDNFFDLVIDWMDHFPLDREI